MLTDKGKDERERNKNDGYTAVLDEQGYQFSLGIDDPDEIAELYEEAGYYARKEAQERAKYDAKEACRYLGRGDKISKKKLIKNTKKRQQTKVQ